MILPMDAYLVKKLLLKDGLLLVPVIPIALDCIMEPQEVAHAIIKIRMGLGIARDLMEKLIIKLNLGS